MLYANQNKETRMIDYMCRVVESEAAGPWRAVVYY